MTPGADSGTMVRDGDDSGADSRLADSSASSAPDSSAGAADGSPSGSTAPAEPTVSNRKEDVEIGTEHWGWTDATVGWFVRYRIQGGMEMTQEVVDATDDLLLMESKTIMPGMELPGSRQWQARRMVKYEGDVSTDCETSSSDLADESMSIGGQSVTCKVSEASTTCAGVTTESKSWMSDDMPGELVKSMVDGQVSMELIEYRK